YRAYGAVGKTRGLKDRFAQLFLDTRGFDAKACALIAGFEGDTAMVEASRKRFAAIARRFGALALGKGQGERWREGRFHGPYSRDPMMDRGLGVDTLETATRWPNI